MIQSQTILNVADNTGAKKLMCIKVLTSKSNYAKVGDVIVGVIKLCFFFHRFFYMTKIYTEFFLLFLI